MRLNVDAAIADATPASRTLLIEELRLALADLLLIFALVRGIGVVVVVIVIVRFERLV